MKNLYGYFLLNLSILVFVIHSITILLSGIKIEDGCVIHIEDNI